MLEELFRCEPNVAADLPEKRRGNVAPGVDGNGGRAAVGMAELLVGASLAALREAQPLQDLNDFSGFEDRK